MHLKEVRKELIWTPDEDVGLLPVGVLCLADVGVDATDTGRP